MRLGYLWFPHLLLQTVRLDQPGLTGPIIIAAHERVVDADEACLEAGVLPDMALCEARELIPLARVQVNKPDRVRELLDRAFELLERLSDGIEQDGVEGAWFVPAGPLGERYLVAAAADGLMATLGLKARVGVGPGKFIAQIAARRATESIELVEDGRDYLSLLPITLLPLSLQTADRLRLLNIRTIGQLAQIPADSLQRRFGLEGVTAHWLALGEDNTPFRPRHPLPTLTSRHTFEPAIEDRSILLTVVDDLLGRLSAQLRERDQVFRSLRLQFSLEDAPAIERRASLRVATNDPERVRPVLRTLLEEVTLDQPATALMLKLEAISTIVAEQDTLFDRAQVERRRRVQQSLVEITRRYQGRARRIVPGEIHSLFEERRLLSLPYEPDDVPPDPRLMEPAHQLQHIRLIRHDGKIQIADSLRDEIVALHAHWEADDWWPEETRRSYFRVRTKRGVIATIMADYRLREWFLVEKLD
ncbi:MAG: DNA polymerase Y family protein [Chloroflexota bacterium]